MGEIARTTRGIYVKRRLELVDAAIVNDSVRCHEAEIHTEGGSAGIK